LADEHQAIIGVTGPDKGGLAAWWFTRLAVWRAGGRAIRITPRCPRDIGLLDGLIIGGGADVDPTLYGEESNDPLESLKEEERTFRRWLLSLLLFPLIYLVRRLLSTMANPPGGDPDRDALESMLIREALQRGLPVLGICRGAQLLNVIAGGSLHRDLADFYVETPQLTTVWPAKHIEIEPDSRLARILGCTRCRVNSLHSQAVNDLAQGMRIVAREPNGVVQGIEHCQLPFAIGVQWHPEYLPQRRDQQGLFLALVRQAREQPAEVAAGLSD
jgi:putative glutamine amidotransferase